MSSFNPSSNLLQFVLVPGLDFFLKADANSSAAFKLLSWFCNPLIVLPWPGPVLIITESQQKHSRAFFVFVSSGILTPLMAMKKVFLPSFGHCFPM